jgi:hypothetical protein
MFPGFKTGREPEHGLSTAENEITARTQDTGDPFKKNLPVRFAEIDGHVPAKNDIKKSYPGKGFHQISFAELHHCPNIITDFPFIVLVQKIGIQNFFGKAAVNLEPAVSAGARFGDCRTGNICTQQLDLIVIEIRQ